MRALNGPSTSKVVRITPNLRLIDRSINKQVSDNCSFTRLQLIELIDDVKAAMGLTNTWMSGATLPVIDEELITRVFRWYDDLLKLDARLRAAAFEIMQNVREIGSSKVVWHEANKL